MRLIPIILLTGLILETHAFSQENQRHVEKIRECTSLEECGAATRKPGFEIEETRILFHGPTERSRALEQPTILKADEAGNVLQHRGARETAHSLAGGKGVVITRGQVGYEDMTGISHDVMDQQGNTLFKIEGPHVPGVLVAAPDMSYFVGYEASDDYEGEPFTFYARSGAEYARVDNIFLSSAVYKASGGVKSAFAPDGSFLAVSITGQGIAVLDRGGALRWKKAIPRWDGREPQILADGSSLVIEGFVSTHEHAGQPAKISFADVLKMSVEERRKALLPTGFKRENRGVYCFSATTGEQKWFASGWGGLPAPHPSKGLIAVGRKGAKTGRYEAGLFGQDGLRNVIELGDLQYKPALSWIGDSLLFSDRKAALAHHGSEVRQEVEPKGVMAAKFVQQDGKVIWEHRAGREGFDLNVVDGQHFVIREDDHVRLFEIK